MSRGFVKEDDLEHAGTDLPERLVSQHANYVTTAGLAALEKEIQQLDDQRLALTQQKDDPIASQKLAKIDRDIRYIANRLKSAILVNHTNQPTDSVLFGATVTAEDDVGDRHTFTIVGEDEADIAQHKVSWVSPLAKALIGHKVGETVSWQRPAGNLNLEIIEIKYSF
jgi:transcription elongation factor GreB